MKLLKTTLKLGSGTLVAQGITFISIPIISRIYSPSEYGNLVFLLSTTGLFVPIATLKIETLLVTISSETKMNEYFKLSLITSTLISLILGILFFTSQILNNENSQNTKITMAFFFSALLFVQSLSVLTIQLSLRARRYKKITQSSIFQNASTNVLQILLGKIEPTTSMLVGSFFIGRLLGVTPMGKMPIRIYRQTKLNFHKITIFKSILKENKFLIPASFLEVANAGLAIFIISIFFGYQYSGFVGMAQSLLMVPITLFAGSMGSIVAAELSAINRDITRQASDKMQILRQFAKPVFAMFLIYAIFFIFPANAILGVVFSGEWIGLNALVPILSIPIGVNFFWNPFINLLYVERRWVRILKINIVRFFTLVLSAVFCVTFNQNWQITTFVMFTSGAAVQIISMVVSFKNFPIVSRGRNFKMIDGMGFGDSQ
jgi:O-antigen/teichoic acid export membrane protein